MYTAAHAQGAEAYSKSNDGSLVATKAGAPRSLGGVFFAIIRRYAESLGMNWFGLFPPPPWQKKNAGGRGSESAPSQPKPTHAGSGTPDARENSLRFIQGPNAAAPATKARVPQAIISPSVVQPSLEGEAIKQSKPSRLKTTVVGTLSGAPRFDAASGLVELPFTVEMSPTLPKGLPNLGTSRVVAICTRKQFDKVAAAQSITPQTRFIIEGEATPAINRDLQPFLKIVVLRITKPELDQAVREKKVGADTSMPKQTHKG